VFGVGFDCYGKSMARAVIFWAVIGCFTSHIAGGLLQKTSPHFTDFYALPGLRLQRLSVLRTHLCCKAWVRSNLFHKINFFAFQQHHYNNCYSDGAVANQ
jgi:hypothetical protein